MDKSFQTSELGLGLFFFCITAAIKHLQHSCTRSFSAHIFDFSHFIFSLFHKVPVLPSPRPLPPSSEIGKAATLAVVEAGSLLPRVHAAFSMGSLQCLCRELGRSTLHVFSHKQ